MGIKGSYAQLNQLEQALRMSIGGDLKQRLLAAAAREARTQVALEFRQSRDPWGSAWAPLKSRHGQPLRDTGRLGNSFTARATSDGIVVGTNVAYAKYHQTGTRGHAAHSQRRHVNKRGRFVSAAKMSKALERAYDRRVKQREEAEDRGERFRGGAAGPKYQRRVLTFKAGAGKIPARPMLPTGNDPGPVWSPAIRSAIDVAFKNFFSKIAK